MAEAQGVSSPSWSASQSYDSENHWEDSPPRICKASEAEVVVEFGSCKGYWFDGSGSSYSPKDISTLTLSFADCEFTFRDCDNTQWIFDETGAYKSKIPAGGSDPTSVTSTTSSGRIQEVQTPFSSQGSPIVESYFYEYGPELAMAEETPESGPLSFDPGAAGKLICVTLRRRISSGPWSNLRRVVYTYYNESELGGSLGDLKTATVQQLDGTTWVDIGTQYFRYYIAEEANGFAHALKFVLDPEAFAWLAEVAETFDETPFTAPDSLVADYADRYYEYDESTQRVVKLVTQGGLLTYLYSASTHEPEEPSDFNAWTTKVVTTRPDGSQVIEFYNFVESLMLRDLVVEHEHPEPDEHWIESFEFNTNGRMILTASPSAVVSYDEAEDNLDVVLQDHTGLIRTTTYYEETTATPSSPGEVEGYVASTALQEGKLGASIPQSHLTYLQCPNVGMESVFMLAEQTSYRDDAGMVPIVTSYTYDYYPGEAQVLQRTTTLPEVSTDQNGSGESAVQRERYDRQGRITWEQGPRGFIDFFAYDPVTGAMTLKMEDVDWPAVVLPSGWTRPSGLPAPLHLVTDYEYDDQGRTTQTLGPPHDVDGQTVRTASWTVYDDIQRETKTAAGYATGITPTYVYTLTNPVNIQSRTANGRAQKSLQAARASTSGRLSPSDLFPQESWTRWSEQFQNRFRQLVGTIAYHTIPTEGAGTEGDNYNLTIYGYDLMNRQNQMTSPGKTITWTVFDVRGLALETWVGTNDTGATDDDPTGGGASGNDMVLTVDNEYDDGQDGGDGNLTEMTLIVDDNPAHDRVTTFGYDFRNRRTTTAGELDFYQETTYDNLSHAIQIDQKDGGALGLLLARSQTFFDDRGQVYQTWQWGVDESGDPTNKLVNNIWYDAAGKTIKQLPPGSQAFTKTSFDSQGRGVAVYVGYYTEEGDEPYSEVGIITADNKIFEETLYTYDPGGNLIQVTGLQRNHNASGNGVLVPSYNNTQPYARTSFVASWFDGAGRNIATANYGTNGNAALSRPSSVPERSDNVLVTSYDYDPAGNQFQTIDPAGMVARQTFDNLGQVLSTISNYTGSEPGNTTDVTVEMAHNADGNLITLTAVNPDTGNQVTTYEYGVTLDNSDIASNSLLRATIYPDHEDEDDQVTQTYNRQGQVTTLTDQRGVVHEYSYDLLGRPTDDAITTLPEGVDDGVLRISTTYDVRGLPFQVTSYDAASEGDIVNQVQKVYNDFQQLTIEYQSHGGAVNTISTPKVTYGYADGAANTIRAETLTYPNGRVLTSVYAAGDDDMLSRVTSLDDTGDEARVSYTYLGRAAFVASLYPEPDVSWSLITTSGANPYGGLDRFSRVIRNAWTKDVTDLDIIEYGYSRASSRLWRHQTVVTGNDELYTYDSLQRLIDMARGDLVDGNTSIDDMSLAQEWTLDATGNWSNFTTTDTVTPANDLDQQRTSNEVNEITAIAETFGPSWATPAYDRAGNMTTIPKPADPTETFDGVYDAWNRLVEVTDSALYTYDGLNRRLTVDADSEVRHSYYTANWQLVEERLDSDTTADRQFLWGLRYIDNLVLRDRTTTSTLNERLYALQDANWNVTSIVDDEGDVQERFRYDAYGTPTFMDGAFVVQPESIGEIEILYAGYRYDPQGCYYVRNRYLHSTLGGWVSRDPLFFGRYVSVKNKTHSSELHRADRSDNRKKVGPEVLGISRTMSMTLQNIHRRRSAEHLENQHYDNLTIPASFIDLYGYARSSPPNYVDPLGTIPWDLVTCLCCSGAIGAACAGVCAKDGYWDRPGEGFVACFIKCGQTFTFLQNGTVFIVTSACITACAKYAFGRIGAVK